MGCYIKECCLLLNELFSKLLSFYFGNVLRTVLTKKNIIQDHLDCSAQHHDNLDLLFSPFGTAAPVWRPAFTRSLLWHALVLGSGMLKFYGMSSREVLSVLWHAFNSGIEIPIAHTHTHTHTC